MKADNGPILVTGAAGQLGAVGRTVTGLLLERGLSVRAMVHREDARSAALRGAGAEVVVGDLLEPADVYRIVNGCRRIYFGMSVSAGYLEATVTMATVAREVGVDALVNMSQMTVSQMSIQNTTPSPQQRQHWLSEQVLLWSGLPVVTIRPTMFLESFLPLAASSVRERGRIELPFGNGKTSPVAAADVARVVATVLADPAPHLGRLYELTGPRSQDMHGIAREFSDALNREVVYSDTPADNLERELKRLGMPEHLARHVMTMGEFVDAILPPSPMSEFSESYHLRSERAEDAIELLRRAKRKGYVYQPVNGWVTFLAEEGAFEPDERIVAAASHPLLHYVSAEDHGWSFKLFDRTKVVSGYRCDWDNDIRVDDSKYSRAALQQFVPSAQPSLLDDFEGRLHPKDFDELFEAEPSKLLAQALGLEHYDWLAYDYIARDFHDSPEDHPDVTEVT